MINSFQNEVRNTMSSQRARSHTDTRLSMHARELFRCVCAHRGHANARQTMLPVEFALEFTLLHFVEGDHPNVSVMTVPPQGGTSFFHHNRYFVRVGVALTCFHPRTRSGKHAGVSMVVNHLYACDAGRNRSLRSRSTIVKTKARTTESPSQ